MEIEKNCHVGWTYPILVPLLDSDIRMDITRQRFYLANECSELLGMFKTKGGLYCDEVGLGKTLTMLSLVVSNPYAVSFTLL